jgi:ribose 5-phosphate isomerase A
MHDDREEEKKLAALASLKFVEDGQVVGLGSGSTAAYVIQLLGEHVRNGLKIRCISTSLASQNLAKSLGIPITTFDDVHEIDVTIDGADEFDSNLNLIKGKGGALLREKIVASASCKLVIVADSSKQVSVLGRIPLPVEVSRFAHALLTGKMGELGASSVDLRRDAKGDAYVTDEGHLILDCDFGRISDPVALARQLSDTPGVLGHGLFIGMADAVVMAKGHEVFEFTLQAQKKYAV